MGEEHRALRSVWAVDPTARANLAVYSLQSPTVAGERHKLTVQSRSKLGSAESRRLRKQGLIPGVLYGREEPVAIAIAERDLRAALTTQGGLNAVLDVVVESGKTHSSVLKDYQQDAVRGLITHIDLQEVRLDQPIHATVPLTLHGEPVGVQGRRRPLAGARTSSTSRRCRWRCPSTSRPTSPACTSATRSASRR